MKIPRKIVTRVELRKLKFEISKI